MPDFGFDTRKPHEPNQPKRVRIESFANKLRTLFIATRSRMVLIANKVQSLLIANRLRTLLIGGGILLFIGIAVPIGLRSYSSSGLGVLQQGAINVELNGKNIALGIRRHDYSFFHNDFDYDLYVMNADGSNPTRLADGVDPAWSPDGEKIAFQRYRQEDADEDDSSSASASLTEVPYIFVMNADGSDLTRLLDRPKRLLDRPAVEPTWSPDGKKIAFTSYRKEMESYCGIYVMNADGSGEPKKLKTGGPGCASSPSWSPDGNKIAYTSGQGLYVTNVSGAGDTNEPRKLTDYSPDYSTGAPSWSPDGTEIAFAQEASADRGGTPSIYKMDADGSGETQLTHHNDEGLDGQGSPTWSPDGDQIAYEGSVLLRRSLTIETSKVYKMNSDGSSPTLVRDFGKGSELVGLDWQPLP